LLLPGKAIIQQKGSRPYCDPDRFGYHGIRSDLLLRGQASMARKSQQPASRQRSEPEDESQEFPEPETEAGRDEDAASAGEQDARDGPTAFKRGDKKALVGEIWGEMPTATASQVAAEFQQRTGETVSIPTVNGARPGKGSRPRGQKAEAGAKAARTQREAHVERPGPTPAERRSSTAGGPRLSVEDLRRVKQLAGQVGGLQKLKEAVDTLSELTSE
jgi:hypothetical protein